MHIRQTLCKTILVKTKLPASDYVINPYNGCPFACRYCYASQIARWRHPGEEWGSFLDVKVNASEILGKNLESLAKKSKNPKDFGTIFFSSVTDPYIGQEAKFRLTRQCLKRLIEFGYEGGVSFLTKSPLIRRDIDLIKKLNAHVGFTVTTLDDRVSRFLEGNSPPVSYRLAA